MSELSPDRILELGFGFWGSKTLLSAVELGVFSELAAAGDLDGDALRERLGMHSRSARDFFDALVALGLLEREGGRYQNTRITDLFLDRSKPTYVGGILEMLNSRVYRTFGALTEGLRTGQPQNSAKGDADLYEDVYSDPEKLRGFLRAMTAVSAGVAQALIAAFPWRRYRTVVDVGGAEGGVVSRIALAHSHLTGGCFDLAQVGRLCDEHLAAHGLADRLRSTRATSSSTTCLAPTS